MAPKQALAPGSLKIGTGKTATIFESSIWSDDISTYSADQQKADKAKLLEDGETIIGYELRLRGLDALKEKSRTIKVNAIIKHELAHRTNDPHAATAMIRTADSSSIENKTDSKAEISTKSASSSPSPSASSPSPKATIAMATTPVKRKAQPKSRSPTPRTPDSTPEPDSEDQKSATATKGKPSPTKGSKKTASALAVRPAKQTSTAKSFVSSPLPAAKAKGRGIVKFDVNVKVEDSTIAKTTRNNVATQLATKEGSPRRSARIANHLEGEKK